MTAVALVCGVLLAGSALLALVRAERGPSMLDRTVALDVFVTAVVGAIVVESAFSRRTDTLPVLVVLSMVGFVGSVAIARFAAIEPEGEGRIRTPEELALEEAQKQDEESAGSGAGTDDAALHAPVSTRERSEEAGGDR